MVTKSLIYGFHFLMLVLLLVLMSELQPYNIIIIHAEVNAKFIPKN